ncbi:cytochrome P450 9e2-like [Atheta coriaria]|uniref:cytochrome P450 9e2-like n=1 Tax=Dalotia coriaria TaxID=877792 RepID=UPI0031F45419
MLLIIGITAALAALVYFYVKKNFSYWSDKNVPQSDVWTCVVDIQKTLFSSLNFFDFWKQFHLRTKNYRFFGGYQFGTPILFLQDQELIKTMLVKDFDHFPNHRDFVEPSADPIWYRGLFALKGEKWRAMRATLSPSFTGSKMRAMFTLIDKAAKDYVDYYKTGPSQFSLEFKDSFTRLSNDIIATCAFGIQVNSLKDPNNEFYLAAKEATNFGGVLNAIKFMLSASCTTFKKMLKLPIFTENTRKFFSNIIKNTLKLREEQHIIRPDMIHLLMEAKKGLLKHEDENESNHKDTFSMMEPSQIDSNEKIRLSDLDELDIIAQAMLFVSGGFESIATTLSLLAYEIAVNPHVQDRLRAEIKETLEKNNNELSYNAILGMQYMDMVVSESLRKWPTNIMVDRVCSKTYEIPHSVDDYNEPKLTLNPGDIVMVNVYGMHRDPSIYPDPEKFDPERFNNENKHKITPYNYMPFGVGPRHCIAIRFALMEIKTILAHLLLNYELYPIEKTHIPMKLEKSFLFMAKGGYWLGLKRLKQ